MMTKSCCPMDAISDDLLAEIFLRFSSTVTVVRMAATCKRWRRIIAGNTFLYNFRSLHRPSPPPVLGCLVITGKTRHGLTFCPTFHPGNTKFNAFVKRCNFSYPCTPGIRRDGWKLVAICDTVIFLKSKHGEGQNSQQFAVYDPLQQRQAIFGAPPSPFFRDCNTVKFCRGPAYDLVVQKVLRMPWFLVICTFKIGLMMQIAVFSPNTNQWHSYPSRIMRKPDDDFSFKMHANGSLYWVSWSNSSMLALDMRTMIFSTMDLPIEVKRCYHFGETEDDELCIVDITEFNTLQLWIDKKDGNGDGVNRWVREDVSLQEVIDPVITVQEGQPLCLCIMRVRAGYVYLNNWDPWSRLCRILSLHLKTMRLETIRHYRGSRENVHLCTSNSWPPFFQSDKCENEPSNFRMATLSSKNMAQPNVSSVCDKSKGSIHTSNHSEKLVEYSAGSNMDTDPESTHW